MFEIHDDEVDLVLEGLHGLRQKKVEAHIFVTALHPGFTEHDFGIPQIDALIQRIYERED